MDWEVHNRTYAVWKSGGRGSSGSGGSAGAAAVVVAITFKVICDLLRAVAVVVVVVNVFYSKEVVVIPIPNNNIFIAFIAGTCCIWSAAAATVGMQACVGERERVSKKAFLLQLVFS